MADSVKLTPGAARKTAKVVRAFLRRGNSLNGVRPLPPRSFQETVWGRLTGEGTGDNAGHFGWEEVTKTSTDWDAVDDGRTGTITDGYAFEVNSEEPELGDVYLLRRTPVPKSDDSAAGSISTDEKDWQTAWAFSVTSSGGGDARRFKLTGSGWKAFDGTSTSGLAVGITLVMGHATGDVITAVLTDNGGTGGTAQWVEVPAASVGSQYQVLQFDSVGRWIPDWVRAH